MKLIDKFLDSITMYRLLIYYLLVLLAVAVGLSAFNVLQYSPLGIIFSASYITLIAWLSNLVFAYIFEAPSVGESSIITGLILALIINPLQNTHDILFLTAAPGLAIASKYILAIRNRHIFNPAAAAVFLTAIGPGQTASWWVGNQYLLPVVVLGGLLIVRKIERGPMVTAFLASAALSVSVLAAHSHHNVWLSLKTTVLHSSLAFLAFVMLTEPATSPSTRSKRIWYGALTGLMFSPNFHIGGIYSTPERDLLVANVFAFLVSSKAKLKLALSRKIAASKSVVDFLFWPTQAFAYQPGQYMEWTLPHQHADSRGGRRYFTLASSPTENELRIGVKFYECGSSFKKAMLEMDHSTPIAAGQLSGDFTMPADTSQKLAFIAGGIGITPFRSMIKYLTDKSERRDIVLVYSESELGAFSYTDIFKHATAKFGLKTIYTLTGKPPANWNGRTGQISAELVRRDIPDYAERLFYISGPQPMVDGVKKELISLGMPRRQIKTDFFPGYA